MWQYFNTAVVGGWIPSLDCFDLQENSEKEFYRYRKNFTGTRRGDGGRRRRRRRSLHLLLHKDRKPFTNPFQIFCCIFNSLPNRDFGYEFRPIDRFRVTSHRRTYMQLPTFCLRFEFCSHKNNTGSEDHYGNNSELDVIRDSKVVIHDYGDLRYPPTCFSFPKYSLFSISNATISAPCVISMGAKNAI